MARRFLRNRVRAVHTTLQTCYVDPGLASPAEPLQIESAKIHAPPGILPPDPADLLRPFLPAGEAAGDAQQPPPQVPTNGRGRGCPKGATKCPKCTQNKKRCGPSCPNWQDVQPVAQTAPPAQLPALAAAATPLQSALDATEGSSAEPRPLLAAAATAAMRAPSRASAPAAALATASARTRTTASARASPASTSTSQARPASTRCCRARRRRRTASGRRK